MSIINLKDIAKGFQTLLTPYTPIFPKRTEHDHYLSQSRDNIYFYIFDGNSLDPLIMLRVPKVKEGELNSNFTSFQVDIPSNAYGVFDPDLFVLISESTFLLKD